MRKIIVAAVLMMVASRAWCASGPATVINSLGLAYSTSPVINLQAYGSPQSAATKLSAQITSSSASFTTATFKDGSQSTGSVTFASTNILAVAATNQITVPSTALILGSGATEQITISSCVPNSTVFFNARGVKEGIDWNCGTTTTTGAKSLAAAFNIVFGNIFTSTNVTNVVWSTATVIGTSGNSYTTTSSSQPAYSTTTWSGGLNRALQAASITFNGVPYINGDQWNDQSNTSTGTAANVGQFMNTLNGITATAATAIGATASTSVVVNSTSGLTAAKITLSGTGVVNLLNGTNWTAVNTTTGTAAALSTACNLFTSVTGIICSNASNSSTVFATATVRGISGNSYFITSSTPSAISSATFLGGTADTFGSTVFSTATVAGSAGNSFTLASSNAGMTVAKPTFTNGQDAATFTLNGIALTAGVNFSTGSTTTDATNLATALNALSPKIVSAQGIGAVVTATSTVTGTVTNYTMSTNQTSNLTLSGATMTGGTTAADTLNSATINLPAHGFTTALPVLYTTGTVAIGNLAWGTTYFVVVVDSNNVQLSSTSTQAVLGVGLVISSTNTQTSAHTYTLAPLAFTQGTAAGKWQVSNDGLSFADFSTTAANVSVSTQTFTPVFPSTTTVQDFGLVDYGYMRYQFTPPTQGGIALKVILNAKD